MANSQEYLYETLPLPLHQLCQVAEKLSLCIQPGDVMLLFGDLGTGKTTFVQCMALGLGISDDQCVSSPSYALMHEYEGACMPVYHMDLYRLNNADDVEAAGLLDYFTEKSVCIVEWPERLGDVCPDDYLSVTLVSTEANKRKIFVQPYGPSWHKRAAKLRKICAEFQNIDL